MDKCIGSDAVRAGQIHSIVTLPIATASKIQQFDGFMSEEIPTMHELAWPSMTNSGGNLLSTQPALFAPSPAAARKVLQIKKPFTEDIHGFPRGTSPHGSR